MAEQDALSSLKNAKVALDHGLISDTDFDAVKQAFLKAQQFRAGLDAGFIQQEDYQHVKERFLNALEGLAVTAGPGAAAGLPSPPSNGSHSSLENGLADSTPAVQPAVSPATATGHVHAASPATSPQPTSAPPSPARTAEIPTNIPRLGGALRAKKGPSTSMSGIAVQEDAVNLFYWMKAKSTYRWATWMVNSGGKEVVIASVGDKDSTYNDFLAALPPTDCRYAVFDYQITNSEGSVFNKLLFISWAPDTAKIKSKMMYASTKDFFKQLLEGLSIEMQVTDLDDLRESDIQEQVRSTLARK